MEHTMQFRKVAKAMARIDFCMMQTVGEHGVSTRPMSNNGEVQYDGDNWFFSRTDSAKVREIAADHRVHLSFASKRGPNFIAVWGHGSVVNDVTLKRELWHKALAFWFKDGPEDPELCLIKVTAHRIQTWGRVGDIVLE